MDNKELVILAGKPAGGGGSVSSVNGQTGAVVLDYEDVGAASAAEQAQLITRVSNVEGTRVPKGVTTDTLTPAINRKYVYRNALTSLTITDPPATGAYSIVFTSGATATTTTIPATILGLESFAPEANTMYEINVLDNRAVVGKWAVPV